MNNIHTKHPIGVSIGKNLSTIYQKQIKDHKILTDQEEVTITKIIYDDLEDNVKKKAARNKLIAANLKLVVFIAKKYSNCGVDLMDLIQEGNLGLMKAVDNFNYKLGYKFSTYAYWCIKRTITRSLINKSKIIKIPLEALKIINQVAAISKKLRQNGVEPTLTTIAQSINLNDAKILEIMMINKPPISLETTVGESCQTIQDLIADHNTTDPNAVLIDQELTEWLEQLTPKESQILKMRFGINTNCEHTLAEIGLQFGLSRERIRQLETQALQKLRQIRKATNY